MISFAASILAAFAVITNNFAANAAEIGYRSECFYKRAYSILLKNISHRKPSSFIKIQHRIDQHE